MPRGKVTRIQDGDTFKVKDGPYIRLEGVDAPEKRQKGFNKAKEDLRTLIGDKTVTYDPVGKSYDRVVAKVKVGKKSVNAAMRRKGYR